MEKNNKERGGKWANQKLVCQKRRASFEPEVSLTINF
jgi:hypothetical protein